MNLFTMLIYYIFKLFYYLYCFCGAVVFFTLGFILIGPAVVVFLVFMLAAASNLLGISAASSIFGGENAPYYAISIMLFFGCLTVYCFRYFIQQPDLNPERPVFTDPSIPLSVRISKVSRFLTKTLPQYLRNSYARYLSFALGVIIFGILFLLLVGEPIIDFIRSTCSYIGISSAVPELLFLLTVAFYSGVFGIVTAAQFHKPTARWMEEFHKKYGK